MTKFPDVELTGKEEKLLMAACIEVGIRAVFDLHVYQFAGKVYRQTDGGPIGLRLTGACAKVKMAAWSVKVSEILMENHVKIWLAAGYIDDLRYLTSKIQHGRRWCKKEKMLKYDKDWEKEDLEKGYTDEEKTSMELRNIMNSVYQDITFTTELASEF